MINYIKQLTSVLEIIRDDNRLNPTHVSMYLALFHYWNYSRFSSPLSINRNEIMKLSKIGSYTTYHKCINNLHNWKYIIYHPSHNPLKGSNVSFIKFYTSTRLDLVDRVSNSGQDLVDSVSKNEQELVSIKTITNSKHNKHKLFVKRDFESIKNYFLKIKSTIREAEKFFNFYEASGWRMGGGAKIKNWKPAARNWISKACEIKNYQTITADDQNMDNLHIENDKPYDVPL